MVLSGTVKDGKDQLVAAATVFCEETQLYSVTDEKGKFTVTVPSNLSQINIKISAVGKKSVDRTIDQKDFSKTIDIVLVDNSLTLKEVQINSSYAKSKNSISSITFDEEAIERVQAFSLADVLNPEKQ